MIIPESLYLKLISKKCVLFLGAGASIDSGGPNAKDLCKFIYNQIGCPEIEYHEQLDRYAQTLDNNGYRMEMENIIKERVKNLSPSKEFKKIINIPWKAIYTTNYDDLVEKAYLTKAYYSVVKDDINKPRQSYAENEIPLYKLHGCINENHRLILTVADIKHNMKVKNIIINRLIDDMVDCFIFVGYSFNDGLVTPILDKFLYSDKWDSIKEKYIVTPNLDSEAKQDLGIYRIKHLCGTSDDFFKALAEKTDGDIKIKLKRIEDQIKSQPIIKNLEIATIGNIEYNFDYFKTTNSYPFDPNHFYRGGNPSWGEIINDADVDRIITQVDGEGKKEVNSRDLGRIISDIADKDKMAKIELSGAAVSGKSTILYRMGHDLTKLGYLALIFKNQTVYKKGLLHDIFVQLDKPFVVLVDNLTMSYQEVVKMIYEAQTRNLSIIFVLSFRHSEWDKYVGTYQKGRIEPFNYQFCVNDRINPIESQKLVNNLMDYQLVRVSSEFEREAVIRKFSKHENLIEILLEVIDRNNINDTICSEYDDLSNEAKEAYGLVSLVYQYDLILKWEILQRALDEKYKFTWSEFVDKILKSEAKGNLFEVERGGWNYLAGRHRYISKLIIDMHYKGNYSKEIEAIELIIKNINYSNEEERFIGGFLHKLVIDTNEGYGEEFILKILDLAIDKVKYEENKAYITHIKGEYLLSKNKYSDAIVAFDSNIQHGLNLPHSIHSLGKSYFYKARTIEKSSGEYRFNLNKSIEILMNGLIDFPNNEYYYSFLLFIFDNLKKEKTISEKDIKDEATVVEKGIRYLGQEKLEKIKCNYAEDSLLLQDEE